MGSRSCRRQPDVRWRVAYGLTIGLLLAPTGDVAAQSHEASNDRSSRAVMIDTVVGVQDYFAESRSGETQTIIDTFATVEMAPRLQASFRPLLWRKTMADGRAPSSMRLSNMTSIAVRIGVSRPASSRRQSVSA